MIPPILLAILLSTAMTTTAHEPTIAELEQSLRATETAFAQTMADRDLEAFASFIAEDAVFSGAAGALRGRDAIVDSWSRFFEDPEAPFSWRPERVFVTGDRRMGGTTGPVHDPSGKVIGQFVSTWQMQGDGTWKVVLDLAPDCR